jgi:hypothetical protein
MFPESLADTLRIASPSIRRSWVANKPFFAELLTQKAPAGTCHQFAYMARVAFWKVAPGGGSFCTASSKFTMYSHQLL